MFVRRSFVGALIVIISASSFAAASRNCVANVVQQYQLPPTELRFLNRFLTFDPDYLKLVQEQVSPNPSELLRTLFQALTRSPGDLNRIIWQLIRGRRCDESRDGGQICSNRPAIGSGLAQLKPNIFLGLTDRGPTQDCEDLVETDPVKYASAKGKKGKGLPLRNFSPTMIIFRVNRRKGSLEPLKYVFLRDSRGRPISGLSNTKMDDTIYARDCAGDPLPLDSNGLDPEEIALIPNSRYVAIVEELSPSVLIVNRVTGVVAARYVPKSIAPLLQDATYPVVGELPDIFMKRRRNRGFEALVVDREGKYLIAILQSPMISENVEESENNAIIRCALFKIASQGKGRPPILKYDKSFAVEASNPKAYMEKNRPRDMKWSGAFYAGKHQFVGLERAEGQVKLFLVDWRNVTYLDDTQFADNLGLEIATNGVRTAASLGVTTATKTLIWDSALGVGGTSNWDASFMQEGVVIDMKDPSTLWMIEDNDFGLEKNGNTVMNRIKLGRSIEGSTICDMPVPPRAPRNFSTNPSHVITLEDPQTFRISDVPGAGAAENLVVDEGTGMIYVANGESSTFDKYNGTASPPSPLKSFPVDGFEPTSASVCSVDGRIALGGANKASEKPGQIFIVDPDFNTLEVLSDPACILPDHVLWDPSCTFLVAACEGEGAEVPGGVLVAEFNNEGRKSVRVADFSAFDSKVQELKRKGVRLVESQKASLDFEPEYLTFVGNNAFVTLQENNAIAVVDLFEAVVTEIKPIGYFPRSVNGFGLDASDRDDKINIRNYPRLFAMPQPDSIVSYVAADGQTYLVTANEGDAKDEEESRVKDITDPNELNRTVPVELLQFVQDDSLLGRLEFSNIMGFDPATNTQVNIFHFGSRSFTIFATDGSIIFDSGEWIPRIVASKFPAIFNAEGFDDESLDKSQADLFDSRSDAKGVEPESLSILTTERGANYMFLGLERPSIIVVFDISNPYNPTFVEAVQNHPINTPISEAFSKGQQGDLDPEGLFASLKMKKLFVAGSVSNTVTSYTIKGL